jgi:hypothetical protein
MGGHFHEGRATAGDKAGDKAEPVPVNGVEGATVSLEDADGALDNEAVEIVWAQIGGEGLPEAVQKIEYPGFLGLNFLPGALGLEEPAAQGAVPKEECDATADPQDEKKERPCHVANITLRDADPASNNRVRP